ncbi:MAG: ribonuclease III domain-containing protein [Erysipelotrichaceae bacterium]|nr:ribonuclease III domain-containing protein [Erysipelotrichaceae bacterium]
MIDIKQLNGATLAFIGDALMTLKVREYLVNHGYTNTKQLQEMSIEYVSARAQANFMMVIIDKLTTEEMLIYKRGRNHKSNTIPKNADVNQYRMATGLEALWGYWHLIGEYKRIDQMFRLMTEKNNP